MELKGKKILVIGMGLSGVSAAILAAREGARVTINDYQPREQLEPYLEKVRPYKNIQVVPGGHPVGLVDPAVALVIKNPGIPGDLPLLEKARKMGIKVLTEVEVAYWYCRGRVLGITGTNGKTTTTALLGEIYKAAGGEVHVAGNIGVPLCDVAREAGPGSTVVAELSSFQLEGIEKFRPFISVLLNITPDHLDRHQTMENYRAAKKQIFKNQGEEDLAVLNRDDPALEGWEREIQARVVYFSRQKILKEGIYLDNQHIVIKEPGELLPVGPVKNIRLPGKHNLENILAAVAAAYHGGISPETIRDVLEKFPGVPHRLEEVGNYGGITFINDSKGTNEGATLKALEAFEPGIILLAGGKDKGAGFDLLAPAMGWRVKRLILLGETRDKLARAARGAGLTRITMVDTMEEAVRAAYQAGEPGDRVLLSPACASWDMYKDYEERGNHFKEQVRWWGRSYHGQD